MRPLHMPFHKILSDEALTANVTAVRPESAVTRLVPFAFVFAQEPQRTTNKYSVDTQGQPIWNQQTTQSKQRVAAQRELQHGPKYGPYACSVDRTR